MQSDLLLYSEHLIFFKAYKLAQLPRVVYITRLQRLEMTNALAYSEN